MVCNELIGVETHVVAAGGVGMVLINEQFKELAFNYGLPTSLVGDKEGDLITKYLNSSR